MIGTTTGIERGCGYREQGGAYLECGLDEDGAPLEEFLIDPPRAFDIDTKIGQELIDVNGTVHIFDWIGSGHYPYVSDFVEEVRRYGVSRRISRNFDLDRLSRESRMILVHKRARFEGHAEDREFVETHGDGLPSRHCAFYEQQGEEAHLDFPTGACTRKWWWDAEPNAEKYTRKVASFEYGPVLGAEMPDPVPAIFASFPISNVAVIQANDGSHNDLAADLHERNPQIPVVTTQA
jgi:hypothetical protein